MEYDLNSPNIPRSNSTAEKARQEKINFTQRNKTNKKSISRRNSVDTGSKTSLETNIQVHIRVNKPF